MEQWKDIQDFEGLYQVSSYGNVRSLPRHILNKNDKPQFYPGKMLKTFWKKEGNSFYGHSTLSKHHVRYDILTHRLVAKAFIPNPENKPHINHIDNNAMNNKIENLEWCTHSENMIHAQKQGRLFHSQSKGGIEGGKVNFKKLEEKFSLVKGTTIGRWLVLNKDIAFKRGSKYYANCKCSCGEIRPLELGRILRKEITSCHACSRYYKEDNDIVWAV